MTLEKTHGSEKIQIDLMVNDQVSTAPVITAVILPLLYLDSSECLTQLAHNESDHCFCTCTCSLWILARFTKSWQKETMRR